MDLRLLWLLSSYQEYCDFIVNMIDFAAIPLIVSLAYKQLSWDNLETRPTQNRVRDTVLFDIRLTPRWLSDGVVMAWIVAAIKHGV